ncbi:MAG: divergent PAP2 family protein [Candidatus Limiplasma sp.]|nr:divergent PAP2 family protein [Candidatus Limiplasma sp.]
MHSILGLGANHVLFAALISWFVAQTLKIPIYHHVEHVWDFSRFHGSGGMPSSHSAMVTGTAVMIGGLYGFDSGLFALSVVVAMIVMYDAAGVRRETGTQATVINQILKDMLLNGKKISDEELKELVGHTPLEVAGGALTGLAVAVIYLLIMFA